MLPHQGHEPRAIPDLTETAADLNLLIASEESFQPVAHPCVDPSRQLQISLMSEIDDEGDVLDCGGHPVVVPGDRLRSI
jgi:hypothetical protein